VVWHIILLLLDLTAAFDIADHNVLISCLDHCVGTRGTALEWFRSYLEVFVKQFHILFCSIIVGSYRGQYLGLSFSLCIYRFILRKHKKFSIGGCSSGGRAVVTWQRLKPFFKWTILKQ